MKHRVIASLLTAFAISALAQPKPETLQSLPKDPVQRIYYGEYYDPQEYAKCLAQRKAENRDPRVDGCYIYRERLEPLDPKRRDEFGEFYDPKKFHECRARVQPNDMQCSYLILRRIVQREIWPDTAVPKPKLPEPGNSLAFKSGIKANEYFDVLCKAESGEFIYKTVDNVEGVYQIRPRAWANTYRLHDRYVMEDPYGYTQTEAERAPNIFVGPEKYRFFEVPVEREYIRDKVLDGKYFHDSVFQRPGSGDKVARYYGYDNRDPKSLKKEYDSRLKSRYGYTWREIKRPHDRENGISGGELIVLDLSTNEVLGIRRGFILAAKSRYSRSGLTWESGRVCPRLTDRPGWPKDVDFTVWFVAKVLRPVDDGQGRRNAEQRK